MGVSLIIKGADFSAHAIDAEIIEIPCTGLTISAATGALEVGGSPLALTVVKTPANTTDSLRWSTSDATVATVDGGLVTAIGAGTATITATCGLQTTTCIITVTAAAAQTWVTLADRFLYGTPSPEGGNGLATMDPLSSNAHHSVIRICDSGNLRVYTKVNDVPYYPYKMPDGTTKVRITLPGDLIYVRAWGFFNSERAASGYPEVADMLYHYRGDQTVGNSVVEISVPVIENYPACDSFCYQLRTRNDTDFDLSLISQVTVEFLGA